MSRKTKRNQQNKGALAVPTSNSPYFATQASPARGNLWVFPQDTRKQLSQWSRITLMLKSRTLIANYGPARAVQNLAALIGCLKPQAKSGDREWNDMAEERFNTIANSALSFDAAGKRTFGTWQTFTTFRRFSDGDCFSILTSSQSGVAKVAGREGHQCASPSTTGTWMDGVRVDANGFARNYNFRRLDDNEDYSLPNRAVHHHANFENMGGTRGVPILAHAINDFHDAIETKSFVKRAIKMAAAVGLTRKFDSTKDDFTPSRVGIGSGLESNPFIPAGAGVGTVPATKNVTIEDIFDAGILSSIPLDVVHDDRPHPNAEEFQKRLMRECAIGIGVPPSILYYMDSPGGAEIRTQIESFARFIFDQHANHLMPFCQRFWTYCIGKEILEGRLPAPSKGDFYKVKWSPPKSITADLGKMGNLLVSLRKACLTTYADHYESLGYDYEDQLEQCAKEARLLLDLEKTYALPAGMLTNGVHDSGNDVQPVPAAA